jgi:hypothetical protein
LKEINETALLANETQPQRTAATLRRDPRIDFHEQVTEGVTNDLRVRLDEVLDPTAAATALNIPLRAGETSIDLYVTLNAPGFDVQPVGDRKIKVRLERDPATEHVDFRLTARHPGPNPARRIVCADFWLGNQPIGSVKHATFVIPNGWTGPSPSDGSGASFGLLVPPVRREDSDFTILVEGDDETGQPPLRIAMRSEFPGE